MGDSKIITRLFFRLLPVQIILVAIGSINSIIDGAIASRFIGPIAISVIGLYLPLLKFTDTVNAVMLGGSQIMCGQFIGKGELDKTGKVFSLDLLVTLAFSGVIALPCLFAPSLVGGILGADAKTAADMAQYLRGMSFGITGTMISAQLSVFLQLEQQEKRTYVGIAVMAVSNVALNLLFVRVFSLGMFGLGLSTTISSWLFCIVQASYYFTGKSAVRFSVKGLDLSYLAPMIKIGIPGAIVQLCLTVRGLALNQMILRFAGRNALAAFASVGTFGCVYYAVTAGVASATRLLASVYYGEEDRAGLLMIMKTALTKGVGLVAGAAAISILLAPLFTSFFYSDPGSEVYRLALQYFRIFPISMPLSAFCVVFLNYYQCSDRMKIVNIISVIDGVIGVCLSSLILAPFMGAMGIWIAQPLAGYYTTAAIILYSVWVNGKLPTSLEDLLVIRPDFGVPEEDRLDISVTNQDDVLDTSQKVFDFCTDHGVVYKHAFYSGLCIEEMAGNIVDHGFEKDRKNSIDIRVVYKKDEILIRFKDSCKPFDPKEFAKLFKPDDVTHNIGIRMVCRISKEMDYNYVLGLNVLTIKV